MYNSIANIEVDLFAIIVKEIVNLDKYIYNLSLFPIQNTPIWKLFSTDL